jgi:hypothetical protein
MSYCSISRLTTCDRILKLTLHFKSLVPCMFLPIWLSLMLETATLLSTNTITNFTVFYALMCCKFVLLGDSIYMSCAEAHSTFDLLSEVFLGCFLKFPSWSYSSSSIVPVHYALFCQSFSLLWQCPTHLLLMFTVISFLPALFSQWCWLEIAFDCLMFRSLLKQQMPLNCVVSQFCKRTVCVKNS